MNLVPILIELTQAVRAFADHDPYSEMLLKALVLKGADPTEVKLWVELCDANDRAEKALKELRGSQP